MTTTVASSKRATFNGQPSDDLHIYYNPSQPGLEQMEAYGLDFSANNDNSSYSYDMKPAQVAVTITNAPGSLAEIKAGSATVGYAQADVSLVSGTGNASILPMTDFDDLIAIGYNSIGASTAQAEWTTTTPVTVAASTAAPRLLSASTGARHCVRRSRVRSASTRASRARRSRWC